MCLHLWNRGLLWGCESSCRQVVVKRCPCFLSAACSCPFTLPLFVFWATGSVKTWVSGAFHQDGISSPHPSSLYWLIYSTPADDRFLLMQPTWCQLTWRWEHLTLPFCAAWTCGLLKKGQLPRRARCPCGLSVSILPFARKLVRPAG